jgi:TonB family protein
MSRMLPGGNNGSGAPGDRPGNNVPATGGFSAARRRAAAREARLLEEAAQPVQAGRKRFGSWGGAACFGFLLCFALFSFIAWIQPALKGNERIEIPAAIRVSLSRSGDKSASSLKRADHRFKDREQKAPARQSKAKAKTVKASAASTPKAARASASSAFAGVKSFALANLSGLGGAGASIQIDMSAEEAAVRQEAGEVQQWMKRREMMRDAPSRSRGGGPGGGSKAGAALDIRIGSSDQEVIPEPPYPERAKSEQKEGFVEIRVLVSITGTVLKHELTGASPVGYFEPSVVGILPQCRFAPAADENGRPIEHWRDLRFEFNLAKGI